MYQSHTGTPHAPTPAATVKFSAVQAKPAVDAATESAVQPAVDDEPPTHLFHTDRMKKTFDFFLIFF